MPVLAGPRVGDRSSERPSHSLEPVAHPEHRDPSREQGSVERGCTRRIHAGRSPREDHRRGVPSQEVRDRLGVRDHLAVDASLADAAGDELGVLGAVVDDEDRPSLERVNL